MSESGMDERTRWEELYATGQRPHRPPSAWILEAVAGLPNDRPVLDLAGGHGRHAVPLSRAGRRVVLVDFSATAVRDAVGHDPAILGVVTDVTRLPFASSCFGVVVVSNFLDRAVFGTIADLIAPGGHLVYETYTTAHTRLVEQGLARGPSSSRFLLQPGELPRLVAPLDVIDSTEGEVADAAGRRHTARVIARRHA
jgi:SAM-dependent methyltransferase